MKKELYINTEKASYFLWEYTKHINALDLWYCAEDIGFFLAQRRLTEYSGLALITLLPKDDREYVEFVRHVAYRIFLFTNDNDKIKNWFVAENLLQNGEWLEAVCNIAYIYSSINEGEAGIADSIRSEKIRKSFNS